MAEINMVFSPGVAIGSIDKIGFDISREGERALIIADASLEYVASDLQQRLDHRSIDCIMFVREGLLNETAALDEALSLVRGSRSRAVIGVGSEEVLSLARITAAVAASGEKAATVMEKGRVDVPGLPLAEIPSPSRFSLMYRNSGILADTATRRTIFVRIAGFDSHYIVVDPSLNAQQPIGTTAQSVSAVLSSSIEAFLSPRSTFLSDIQARTAVKNSAGLLRDVKYEYSDPDFRLREAENAVLSGFSTGLTGPGPVFILSATIAALTGVSSAEAYTVLLPWALESPLYIGSPKATELSRAMADPGEEASGVPAEELRSLFGRLGLPGRLRDLGADLDLLYPAAEWAVAMVGQDRTDLDEAAFRDLLEISS